MSQTIIPVSSIATTNASYNVPDEVRVIAVPEKMIHTAVSDYFFKRHGKKLTVMREIYPWIDWHGHTILLNILPHGAIEYNEGKKVGIMELDRWGDFRSDFIALERTNNYKLAIVSGELKMLPVFKVTDKQPEAYLYHLTYRFPETCDKIYLREIRNVMSFVIMCEENEDDDPLVNVSFIASTSKDVVIDLESQSKYYKDVVYWNENKVEVSPYEDLEAQDII